MTFNNFEQIVKKHYPNCKLFKHGEFAGNKINVAVIFNGEHGRVYKYNGTYCDVLNRLGIKAIYEHNYQSYKNALEVAKRTHGKKNPFFGGTMDNSREIEEYTNYLNDIEQNYVII